jgi:4-amino-4-deoxy-L-arabinose transferase-like glycosyltransferase
VVLLVLLVAALALRVVLASSWAYVYDESDTWIPLVETISFASETRYLPVRAQNHPALPAYVVKASSQLFGTTPLGYRGLHVLASLLVVCLVYRFVRSAYGPGAALWAAALLAFNEYFLAVSSRATAHVPYLLCVTAGLCAFGEFLRRGRIGWLYSAGAAVGLAFYAKEHAALLVPVFFLVLLLPAHRRWLRSPHPYLACAVFALVIAPDVAWNLGGAAAEDQATYGNHLQRIGCLGLSQYPTAFYVRDLVREVQPRLSGVEFDDNTTEYQAMHPGLGGLLLATVLVTTFRRSRDGDAARGLLVAAFWGVFGFFSLIRPGEPDGLDPVSWIWVDASMIPAVAMAGARLAAAGGWWRLPAWGVGAAAVAYAVVRMAGTV